MNSWILLKKTSKTWLVIVAVKCPSVETVYILFYLSKGNVLFFSFPFLFCFLVLLGIEPGTFPILTPTNPCQ